MQQEKFTAAYTFVRIWRLLAYSIMLAGSLAALGCCVVTLGMGLVAFFSQTGTKWAARQSHNAFEERCLQQMEEARQEFKKYAEELPKRLESIRTRHQEELQQHKRDIQQYVSSLRQVVDQYNNVAQEADNELKRLAVLKPESYIPLTVAAPDISTKEEHGSYQQAINKKAAQLTQYQQAIQDSIMNSFAAYETPLINKVNGLTRQVQELHDKIRTTREDYKRRIEELLSHTRRIPETTYAARPQKNIYGTDEVERLQNIFDISDLLPLVSANLSNEQPLVENNRLQLRKNILTLTDWLPRYTRTFAPSQADIEAIYEHNRNINQKIASLQQELQASVNTLNQELRQKERELNQFKQRKQISDGQKEKLKEYTSTATHGWAICPAQEKLINQLQTPFPEAPEELQVKLQREQERVPQKEAEMQQRIQQLQQNISSSEKKLKATRATLSAVERKACAAQLTIMTSMTCWILPATWLSFAILLILADFMICPLVNATKAQEIADNTRTKQNS